MIADSRGGSMTRWIRTLAPALVTTLLALDPAAAADEPDGIGFAQAEEGTWWCRGVTAGQALHCAREKCLAESGGQDCHPTRWCFPAGWSALMVTWLPEFHATQVLCGMPGEEAARSAMKAICEAGVEFTRCDLVLFIDPEGGQREASDASWPGPATAVPSP
jgi:hypothetical protein